MKHSYYSESKIKHRRVCTLEIKGTLEEMCLARNDRKALEVYGRLAGLNDLVSEEAMYCVSCFVDLGRKNPGQVCTV